jgi:hypothetical protein
MISQNDRIVDSGSQSSSQPHKAVRSRPQQQQQPLRQQPRQSVEE